MNITAGEIIGGINIIVCKTSDGDRFFKIQTDSEDVLPILDIIEDTLTKY